MIRKVATWTDGNRHVSANVTTSGNLGSGFGECARKRRWPGANVLPRSVFSLQVRSDSTPRPLFQRILPYSISHIPPQRASQTGRTACMQVPTSKQADAGVRMTVATSTGFSDSRPGPTAAAGASTDSRQRVASSAGSTPSTTADTSSSRRAALLSSDHNASGIPQVLRQRLPELAV